MEKGITKVNKGMWGLHFQTVDVMVNYFFLGCMV